ncbi:antA/AntB antirepressor family protein [Aliarcobacter butzleri]|uniref:antA/AntB antirepressor family protein n=1 Tax=Aliarcobacter butzleri TaxID=28197 RepID=UPI001587F3E4|nr:antA/AntB antirepressor family protein [Aliarcobacter butzleri]NUW28971.1 antA/AntB antirepressor family protein [Aliarcobacter butzleri]
MTNLIPITKNEIGNTQLNSVNAREIHSYLEVKTKFNDWIRRAISKYDFKENVDFIAITQKRVTAQGNSTEQKDYIVTLDMAKELAMLENNLKGKETRKYFIACEKKLNSNNTNIEKYFELFSNGFNSLTKAIENQQNQINNLTNIVMNLSKQNSYHITQKEQNINITLRLKSDKELMSEDNLSFNEIAILKILAEKKDLLDRKIVGEDSYYKLTMPLLVQHFPIKLSEKTIQRHLNKLRDKKLITIMTRFDGNYIKLNNKALEILGGAR